jgi:hypothetical protein
MMLADARRGTKFTDMDPELGVFPVFVQLDFKASSPKGGEFAQAGRHMVLKSKHTGKLISFEGSEGSGKTSQIARLADRLQKLGATS